MPNGQAQFSDLPPGAQVVSTPQAQFSDLPPGATVISGGDQAAAQPTQPPMAFAPRQEPSTWVGKFGQWAEDVSLDLQDGGDRTGIGTVMQKLGARGLHTGNAAAVGDFMGSLPLGLLRAGKGATEMTPQVLGGPKGRTMQGIEDVLGGGLQAATMPAAFMAPEEAEVAAGGLGRAGEAVTGVAKAAAKPATAAASKAGEIVSGLRGMVTNIPKETESQLVNTIAEAGKAEGFEPSTAGTLKDAIGDYANSFKGRAQEVYRKLQEEAPGFQELRESIEQMKETYAKQINIDPEKAVETEAKLKQAYDTMEDLLDKDQMTRWKAADQDWGRFRSLQEIQGIAHSAAKDLTTSQLKDLDTLRSGMQRLSALKTRGHDPVDMLARGFGQHAGDIRRIVQEGVNLKSNTAAASQFLKWAVPAAGLGYGAVKGGEALAGAIAQQ